jgi:hypothetical protein
MRTSISFVQKGQFRALPFGAQSIFSIERETLQTPLRSSHVPMDCQKVAAHTEASNSQDCQKIDMDIQDSLAALRHMEETWKLRSTPLFRRGSTSDETQVMKISLRTSIGRKFMAG